MSKSAEIGVSEWLAELVALGKKNDQGHTARELADAAGCSVKTMLTRLQQAQALGRLAVGQRSVLRIDGKSMQAPVYRITAPPKAKRK